MLHAHAVANHARAANKDTANAHGLARGWRVADPLAYPQMRWQVLLHNQVCEMHANALLDCWLMQGIRVSLGSNLWSLLS